MGNGCRLPDHMSLGDIDKPYDVYYEFVDWVYSADREAFESGRVELLLQQGKEPHDWTGWASPPTAHMPDHRIGCAARFNH